jgi:hypothetical protein
MVVACELSFMLLEPPGEVPVSGKKPAQTHKRAHNDWPALHGES